MQLALSPMHALFAADPDGSVHIHHRARLFLNPLFASTGVVFGDARVRRALVGPNMA